jgi:FkbM family methyltransferase
MGRERLVRFSRFLSNEARLDGDHHAETLVQQCVLQRLDLAGGVIFDVGANIGNWTRALLQANARRAALQVHLFEPCRGTRRTLEIHARQWQDEGSIRINDCALSSAIGEARFYSFGSGAGRNSLHPTGDGATHITERVRTDTVDHYCREQNIPRIDLLKIDTEGHDLAVLRGAQEMLERERIGVAQFGYNSRWVVARHFLRDAFELLQPLGYTIGKITPAGIEFYPGWDMELESFREAHFIAVKPGLVEAFPRIKWWKEAA